MQFITLNDQQIIEIIPIITKNHEAIMRMIDNYLNMEKSFPSKIKNKIDQAFYFYVFYLCAKINKNQLDYFPYSNTDKWLRKMEIYVSKVADIIASQMILASTAVKIWLLSIAMGFTTTQHILLQNQTNEISSSHFLHNNITPDMGGLICASIVFIIGAILFYIQKKKISKNIVNLAIKRYKEIVNKEGIEPEKAVDIVINEVIQNF